MAATTSQSRTSTSPLTRAALLVASVVAAAALVAIFVDARSRIGAAESATALGRNTVDLFLTQPIDPPVFPDAVIWALPSQRAQFLRTDDEAPFVRVTTPPTGLLVGSQGAEGVVALALLPPGLETGPGELLISPASTALALVALHPDVSSADPETHIARLVAALRSPAFDTLVAQVDGRPLDSWNDDERLVLRNVVNAAVLTEFSMPCADVEALAGSLSRCAGSSDLLNERNRSLVAARADGAPCAIVPGSLSRVTSQGLASLRTLIGAGDVESTGGITTEPGRLLASCGDDPTIASGDADLVMRANRAVVFTDVTIPLARLVGADLELDAPTVLGPDLVELLDATTAGATMDAPTQIRTGIALLTSPTASAQLGVAPLDEGTRNRLDELGSLLEAVYR